MVKECASLLKFQLCSTATGLAKSVERLTAKREFVGLIPEAGLILANTQGLEMTEK